MRWDKVQIVGDCSRVKLGSRRDVSGTAAPNKLLYMSYCDRGVPQFWYPFSCVISEHVDHGCSTTG
jgi:hypothetical protein